MLSYIWNEVGLLASASEEEEEWLSCRFLQSLMERVCRCFTKVLIGSLSDNCNKVFDSLSAEAQRERVS